VVSERLYNPYNPELWKCTKMPLIRLEMTTYRCPHCRSVMGRVRRKFGAPVVTCGQCGQAFETDLQDWTRLSPGQKLRAILAELFVPTFMGKNVIYYFLFLTVALLLGLGAGDTVVLRTTGLVVAALVGLDLILTFRHIGESRRYARTELPPVRQASRLVWEGQELEEECAYECPESGQGVDADEDACPRCGMLLEA
jgi:hypothetical protein